MGGHGAGAAVHTARSEAGGGEGGGGGAPRGGGGGGGGGGTSPANTWAPGTQPPGEINVVLARDLRRLTHPTAR